ncbi:MAG: COX15/CtaA family protein, partial [Alphaproteobacteria bacterium]
MDRSSSAADMPPPHARRALAIWLFLVAGCVGAMTVIGGITRLTESGLSMVEWRPLIGWLPPVSHEEWMRVFELYRATPEYRHVNAGMSLADFQEIFWWEFIHRVWGRLIGVVYALPRLVFWLKGWVKGSLRGRLLLLLALGGLQGFIGWWMVASGLVDRPDDSHYRLAVHLA